ncbi:hypothetical protein BOX15_Mlig002750g1 [Macrostomum lignano]|nr:hypothetical protein BOX15_Mlig002750g1 [Macrostomum lignano]
MHTTTSDQEQQKSTTSKSKESSHESADEMAAEVESAPSQVSPEPADEAPVVLPPPLIDDGRVVSAFCAFRYHKAEFRQLFMRQGSNNNSCYNGLATALSLSSTNSTVSAVDSAEQSLLSPPPPDWVGPLAHCALRLMRSAFRDAPPEAWESLKRRLASFGFKPEVHFALWLRLSSAAADTDAAAMDPVEVFNAIPPLSSLPKRLAAETEVMLQTLNLLSQ